MTDLLLNLALGVGAIILANLGLIRFARLSAKQAAATVALVTLGLYVPMASCAGRAAMRSPCIWRSTCWRRWLAGCCSASAPAGEDCTGGQR